MNVPRARLALRRQNFERLHGWEHVLHFAVTAIAGVLPAYDNATRLHASRFIFDARALCGGLFSR